MYKKGDIIICKTMLKTGGRARRAKIGFIKDKSYKIYGSTKIRGLTPYVEIADERNRVTEFYLESGLGRILYNYFYTVKELRKLKLDKINGKN